MQYTKTFQPEPEPEPEPEEDYSMSQAVSETAPGGTDDVVRLMEKAGLERERCENALEAAGGDLHKAGGALDFWKASTAVSAPASGAAGIPVRVASNPMLVPARR